MKYGESLFIISLREAFLEIIPFSIMSSFSILLYMLVSSYINDSEIINSFYSISNIFQYVFPFLLIITISSKLGKNYNIDYLFTGILAIILFLTISLKIDTTGHIIFLEDKTIFALFLPIITHYSFIYLSNLNFFKIITYDIASSQMKSSLNALLPIIVIFFGFILFLPYLETLGSIISEITLVIFYSIESLELQILIHIIISNITTWVTSVTNPYGFETFGKIEIFPNLTISTYLYSFVYIGGAGAAISLIIAILMYSRNESHRKIAWYALPFSIFNISEVLLFGLPIILNLSLLIPFIIVPIVNFLTTYIFFHFVEATILYENFSQTTPIFLNSNFFTNSQSYLFILHQLFNIILGVILYRPFLKKYDEETSNIKEKLLEEKFGVNGIKIDEHFAEQKEIKYFDAHSKVIEDQVKINRLIDEILEGELLLFYQPQMEMKTNSYYGFESLIRFKTRDGSIVGPYFIPLLEDAGYSHVIDIWVIKQIKKDLELFNKKGFNPKISINLTPSSIANNEVIDLLVDTLGSFNIYIEILERTFALDNEKFRLNLNILQYRGFNICVDDFGSGYSSLQYLHTLPAQSIKIDKALLDNIEEEKGKSLYRSIVTMCHELEYELIAEGVETKEQIRFLKECNINIIQGFYFHKAITANEIINLHKTT